MTMMLAAAAGRKSQDQLGSDAVVAEEVAVRRSVVEVGRGRTDAQLKVAEQTNNAMGDGRRPYFALGREREREGIFLSQINRGEGFLHPAKHSCPPELVCFDD